MITTDNFLPEGLFQELTDYCNNKEFHMIKAGDKLFLMLTTPPVLNQYLQKEGYEIILSFIRKAHKNFDTDARIHADGIIMNEKTHLASVLYISESQTFNGTAFWKHHIHGKELPIDISESEFDRLITEDANDLSKWKKIGFVQNVPNRLLTYNANCFHSKYPSKIEDGERVVLVTFYKKI